MRLRVFTSTLSTVDDEVVSIRLSYDSISVGNQREQAVAVPATRSSVSKPVTLGQQHSRVKVNSTTTGTTFPRPQSLTQSQSALQTLSVNDSLIARACLGAIRSLMQLCQVPGPSSTRIWVASSFDYILISPVRSRTASYGGGCLS